MPKAILGTKLGMTQVFAADGKVVPVTVVEAGPCRIAQIKTMENDGYTAIQLGFGAIKPVNVNKPSKGHTDKAGIDPVKYLREIRTKDISAFNVGDTITVDVFAEGENVDVSGVSKGKGFAGAGYSEKGLFPVAALDSFDELFNCLGLVAGGLKGRNKLKIQSPYLLYARGTFVLCVNFIIQYFLK